MDAKKERKELLAIFKDALSATADWDDLTDKMKGLRDRRKQIQFSVESQLSDHMKKMDQVAKDIASDRQLLADIALAQLIKGKTVKVIGPGDIQFEPRFSIAFKRQGTLY